MASLFSGKSQTRVVIHEEGLVDFLEHNPGIKADMLAAGEAVAAEAQATADSAEEGPGGRIHGYAAAGFDVVWDARGRRPRVNIVSNADKDTFLAAHFHTQKRDGVSHLRAALYKYTHKG